MNTNDASSPASKTALRWENARARSRHCILEAASVVFAEDGFERATMKRIAEVCGVTKVTVYAHFRDKDRLYTTVMDRHLAAMPAPQLGEQHAVALEDALARISDGIQILAADPACQAFCQSLMRSAEGSRVYCEQWDATLQPYRSFATQAFATACPGSNNAADGDTFLRLILAEHALLPGARPRSTRATTIALFTRAYRVAYAG